MYEKLVRRVLWVIECACGNRTEYSDNPPKEVLCACGQWNAPTKLEWTGPDRITT